VSDDPKCPLCSEGAPAEQSLYLHCKGCMIKVAELEKDGEDSGMWRWASSRMKARLTGSLLEVVCEHHGVAGRYSVLVAEPGTAKRDGS